jgi:hypothetical protein
VGGIRRIIVPEELGYPDNDFNKAQPRPTTFSGKGWSQQPKQALQTLSTAAMLGWHSLHCR